MSGIERRLGNRASTVFEVILPAAGYCVVLLLCWLLSAELLRILLGDDRQRLILVGAQLIGILLPALALTKILQDRGFPSNTSPEPPPKRKLLVLSLPGLLVGGYLVGLALNASWYRLLHAPGWPIVQEWEEMLTEAYRELLLADGALELVGVLLMVSLLPAVCEEIAFRRGLQGLLASSWGGTVAVPVTAVVFSFFHLEPFGLPARVFLGVSLGIVYHRTGSLWAAGLLHAGHNLLAVTSLYLAEAYLDGDVGLNEMEAAPTEAIVVTATLGLVAWIVSVQLLRPPRAAAPADAE